MLSRPAAKALTKIFPEFEGKIGGCGIRVPVPDGSLTDITFNVKRAVSIEEINAAFKLASQTNLKGILDYTEDPIVSVDIIGNRNGGRRTNRVGAGGQADRADLDAAGGQAGVGGLAVSAR